MSGNPEFIKRLPNHQLTTLTLQFVDEERELNALIELIEQGGTKESTTLELDGVDPDAQGRLEEVFLLRKSKKIGFTWIQDRKVKRSWSPPAGSSFLQ